jgi:hypothetical protein
LRKDYVEKMGHCIHAIVAPADTADLISSQSPELRLLDHDNGFTVFPIDADFIVARIAPDKTPTLTGDEFMLMTNGFRLFLQSLSIGGQLAYVETEYFGGEGGQGAVVCRNGSEVMPPTWRESDTINDALKLIGMSRGTCADEFVAAGFGLVRNNDQILDQIANAKNDA